MEIFGRLCVTMGCKPASQSLTIHHFVSLEPAANLMRALMTFTAVENILASLHAIWSLRFCAGSKKPCPIEVKRVSQMSNDVFAAM